VKILLIVVAVIVVLCVGVVVTGFLLPKAHVASRSASFRATPEQLFALIAGAQGWRPDLVRYEVVPDAGGRELVRETTRNGETVMYELMARVPDRSIQRRIATEGLPYSGTWEFSLEPGNGGTVVKITERGEVNNPVFRFISRFVFGHTHSIDQYLQALGNAVGQKIEIHN